jgi:Tfp pilus assembly protein PilV
MIELIVAMTVFAVAVLGMVQMSVVSRMTARAGSQQTDMWTVAQLQFEELQAQTFASLVAGTDTVRGYPVSWTVTGTEPKTITMTVTRPDVLGGSTTDTFVMLVSDWAY